ncbi:MAG: hypothetical protein QNK78_09090 [Crocinitomicaceae bacterium]|nr:hypothetical protein [Crocinitomicaceae bacterium]MDC1384733.1 hypothetical protein [Crocinitomicaceae bacterium]|tara:strand:- start:2268 stop:2774 length:507 start_codon:yes stop_codon:yes gene_type:complete
MKHLLVLLAISMASHFSFSQQYNTAVGIKGDWSTLDVDMAQFSVKHFFQEANAVEVNFGAGRRFVWLEGMYLFNHALKGDFDWYTGGGLDLGYWNTNYDNRYDNTTHSGFWGGLTGVFGAEYTFKVVPLNFALDVGPTMRLVPDMEVGIKVGFATRYAFGGKAKKNKR